MGIVRERLSHPAWVTLSGTIAGYALLVLAVFLVLFVLPYLVVSAR